MREIIEYKKRLGRRTRALRKGRGLTQAGLAERLGVTQEYVGKIERGMASPSFPLLLGLARTLGEEPQYLLSSDPVPAREQPCASPCSCPSPEGLHLRELRHRMRNCFQLLANLVNLELMRAKEEDTRQVLRALAARIHCLTLMQGFLAADSEGRSLDLGGKLQKVWEVVSSLYPRPRVRARLRMEEVLAPPDTAQACALVLAEFLTNMYKHAFPGRESGAFFLELEQRDGTVRLVMADDGVGLPPDPTAVQGSMGLTLMRSYVEHSLGGAMRLENRGGATLTVQFPLPAA